MTSRAWIGNDIVDLAEPGVSGKERDRRFLERVFTPAERERILRAAAPTIALWKTWAAKEAAFKVASKVRSRLVFRHRAFEVVTAPIPHVRFDDLVVAVRWETARHYIHCIGQLAGVAANQASGVAQQDAATLARLALTEAEQASAHSTASTRARQFARQLLGRWGLRGVEVVRWRGSEGWKPPVLARHGCHLARFDVSLSHDGRFVAVALSGPRDEDWRN